MAKTTLTCCATCCDQKTKNSYSRRAPAIPQYVQAPRPTAAADMEAPESDELSTLMPNLRQAAQRASSPGETVALREYIKVWRRRRGLQADAQQHNHPACSS